MAGTNIAENETAEELMRAVGAWVKAQDGQYAPGYHYDMMHDHQRNEAYRAAIAEAVQSEEDFVLEIGTGSGLLAMLAAQSGCQHVFTVEGDRVLAGAAKKVVEANGLQQIVTVIPKLSTEVQVAWSADMPCRADVLVAEIFDTGLVGEGVLPSFIDAHNRLLCQGARVVPHAGVVYAAGFHSEYLRSLDLLEGAAHASLAGHPRPEQAECSVPAPVFQVHAGDLLRRQLVRLVTAPVEVMRLEFASPDGLVPEPSSFTRAARVDGW